MYHSQTKVAESWRRYMCGFYKHLRSGPASQSSHSIVNAVAVVSCTRPTLCWHTVHMNAITAHYLLSVTDLLVIVLQKIDQNCKILYKEKKRVIFL